MKIGIVLLQLYLLLFSIPWIFQLWFIVYSFFDYGFCHTMECIEDKDFCHINLHTLLHSIFWSSRDPFLVYGNSGWF